MAYPIKMKGDLNKLFDRQRFKVISENVLERFGNMAGQLGLTHAKSMSPVGSSEEDTHPGQMRDSIYKDIKRFPERVRVIIAIADPPVDYAKHVIYGSRRHRPNNFMLRAKNETVKTLRRNIRIGMGMGDMYWELRNNRNLGGGG